MSFHCKFKFDPKDTSFQMHSDFLFDGELNIEDEFFSCYSIVERPMEIPLCAVREGTYVVREKGYYQEYEYWEKHNVWIKKSRWENSFVTISQWNLLPNLSEKEWLVLFKTPIKYLSERWKKYRWGKQCSNEISETIKGIKKHSYKYDKEHKEDE